MKSKYIKFFFKTLGEKIRIWHEKNMRNLKEIFTKCNKTKQITHRYEESYYDML